MENGVAFLASLAAASIGVALILVLFYLRRYARARERAERRREEELLERLSAGLAHELKNPLGALNLNLHLLEEDLVAANIPDSSRLRLTLIMKEFRRLEDVLDNFLRYASRRHLALADVDINTLVGDLITFLKPEIHRARIDLKSTLAAAPPVCRIDAGLVKQALLNVLLNAIEAMPMSGTLDISTSAADGYVAIIVKDTGVGIEADDVPRIFEAYFSRKSTGMGLGLAITKRIVDDHGGRIDVESGPGAGTTVRVYLPIDGPGSTSAG